MQLCLRDHDVHILLKVVDQPGGNGYKALAPVLGGRLRLLAEIQDPRAYHGVLNRTRQAAGFHPVVVSVDASWNHHYGHPGSAGSFGKEGSEGSGGIGMGMTS